jgi:hypothetical protein
MPAARPAVTAAAVAKALGRKASAAWMCGADGAPPLGPTPNPPAVAVTALLEHETLPPVVWELACAPGAIVGVLRTAGYTVIATDLNDWGCPDSESRRDFLFEQRAPDGCECIITNPPYKLAQEFVLKARELAPKVVMLLRLAFLESERRRNILESGDLARVFVFRNRLPMMHRFGWSGPRASSATAYAWFVWDRAHSGPLMLDRISWVPAGERVRTRMTDINESHSRSILSAQVRESMARP